MPFIERALRVMTRFNIGATLATGLWLLWSGSSVVTTPAQVPTGAMNLRMSSPQTLRPEDTTLIKSSCECLRVTPPAYTTHPNAERVMASATPFAMVASDE